MWWLTRGIKQGQVNHTKYHRKAEIARESSEAGFQRAGGEDNQEATREALALPGVITGAAAENKEAFDDPNMTTPIFSFPYYNNPLSDNCDVTNITLNLVVTKTGSENLWESQPQLSGSITCRIPTPFYLTWSGFPPQVLDETFDKIKTLPSLRMFDLASRWTAAAFIPNNSQVDIGFTAHPCCDCAAVLAGSPLETTSLLQPPCSSYLVQFITIDPYTTLPINISDFIRNTQIFNFTQNVRDFDATCQNLFVAVYHLVRLDLGVILDNQIYNSPQMFIRSIAGINRIGPFSGSREADIARGATSKPGLMAYLQTQVEFFYTCDRVPVMEYLRSIPRIKPLGSAITSVFVSTFAMLSVLWTIFSVIAGALAAARNAPTNRTGDYTTGNGGCTTTELEDGKAIMEEMNTSEGSLLAHQTECVPAWHVPLERMNLEIHKRNMQTDIVLGQMRYSLARMMFSLRKRGLVDDKDGESEMDIEGAQGRGNSFNS
ncbi:hypothetical protein K438DRAFT_1765767 [Mycena galopus ATCC 62051]|nr:hypothetical protein K438DRAFT_1765767 [Mycena galopus ATCC 62051]